MTRDEMYDTIEHLTVVMKFSAGDTAATIKQATGLSVNPEADDLLEALTDAQLERVCERFLQVEQELIKRNAKLKLRVEDERDRALLVKALHNTDLDYSVEGPTVAIQTDVPQATLETLEEIMGKPLIQV
jgi:hypothetical protein